MYDVLIIGAGPGGIFSAYELMERKPDLKIAVFEVGHPLEHRKCPIDGDKIKSCIHCKCCSIMSGFGGAGAFSDGKYNITNDFGGTLYEYIGKKTAIELMEYVDGINLRFGGEGTKLYSTAGTKFKKTCMQHGLHLLDASVRHLGTDINYIVLEHLYDHLKNKVDFYFDCAIETVEKTEKGYKVYSDDTTFEGTKCIISAGRSAVPGMLYEGSVNVDAVPPHCHQAETERHHNQNHAADPDTDSHLFFHCHFHISRHFFPSFLCILETPKVPVSSSMAVFQWSMHIHIF